MKILNIKKNGKYQYQYIRVWWGRMPNEVIINAFKEDAICRVHEYPVHVPEQDTFDLARSEYISHEMSYLTSKN